jgi:hypothetical protein
MNIYYQLSREGQESCANFTDKTHSDRFCQNVSFATNPSCENDLQAVAGQGVEPFACVEGLVTYENPTLTPTPTPSPSTPTTPAYLPLITERLAKQPKPRGRHARKRKPITKAWARLSPAEKLEATFDRAYQREAVAFSLNFSSKKIAKLEASADPARDLSCAINRVAKELLGFPLPLAFSFEFTDDDRLHCHGVAILPDWQEETVNRFRQVLKRAGGVMHGLGSGRQVDVKVLTDLKGWNGYRAKDADRAVEKLGTSKIEYISRELGRVARDDHNADLEKQKTRKTTQRRPARAKQPSASLTHSPATETRQRAAMSQSAAFALPAGSQSKLTYRKCLKNNDIVDLRGLTAIREYAMNSTANITLLEHINHMPQFILDAMTYSRLMDALLAVSADAYVSQDADAFKIALGEIAGIWPETVMADHRDEKFSVAG